MSAGEITGRDGSTPPRITRIGRNAGTHFLRPADDALRVSPMEDFFGGSSQSGSLRMKGHSAVIMEMADEQEESALHIISPYPPLVPPANLRFFDRARTNMSCLSLSSNSV